MKINKMYYGDSQELLKTVPDRFVDLYVTSPPYADATSYGKKINVLHPDLYADWFIPFADQVARSLKDTGSFILNINDKVVDGCRHPYVFETICRILNETELKLFDKYMWIKKSGLPSGNRRLTDRLEYLFHFVIDPKKFKMDMDEVREPYAESSLKRMETPVGVHDAIDDDGKTTTRVKDIPPNPRGKIPDNYFRFPTAGVLKGNTAGLHPAAFHRDLPSWFIRWLTDENDIVGDFFMGSGTTIEACIKYNRQWFGFELNPAYKSLIETRIENAHKDYQSGAKENLRKFFE